LLNNLLVDVKVVFVFDSKHPLKKRRFEMLML